MKRLLIDYRGEAVRAAVMTDKKLTEIFIDRSLVGSIVNGVVSRVLPSRFAFIDIGREKSAFMNLSEGSGIKPGQYIPVQVRKDASGDKGANVSDSLHFKGRMAVVYAAERREVGVSSKITDKAERKRLQSLAEKHLPRGYSCILRTQSSGASDEAIRTEICKLTALCEEIESAAKHSPAPKILYQESLIFSDLLTDDIDEIILNDDAEISKFDDFDKNLKLWREKEELFDAFGVEQQILKALQRNVWLPCGGYVTFDQVEACVFVDVNTGKFLGKKNYRETVLKVNLEAAECIAVQIALRNLSGMIIIDFIDLPDDGDKKRLMASFAAALKQLRVPADIVGMTELGLVQLTRRKQREPLSRILQEPCPHCGGTGKITKRGNQTT